MKFALDTYRDIAHGTRERRIHAAWTFALWFVAGAYVTSTAMFYFAPVEGLVAEIVGGAVVAAAVAAIKLA